MDIRRLKHLVLISGIVGIIFSVILIHHHVSLTGAYQEGPSACVIGEAFDCDRVATSPFSEWFGIPVASYTLFFYLLIFILVLRSSVVGQLENKFRCVLFVLSSVSLLLTVYFASVSYFALRTFCLYCSALYVVNLFLFCISYLGIKGRIAFSESLSLTTKEIANTFTAVVSKSSTPNSLIPKAGTTLLLVIICLLISLSSEQIVTSVIFKSAEEARQKRLLQAAFHSSSSGNNLDVTRFKEKMYEAWKNSPFNDFVIKTGEVDKDYVFGAESAPITLVGFSDFQCPACARWSLQSKKLVQTYTGRVKIVFKNYPLDSACNPQMTNAMHGNACRLAVLARCSGKFGDPYFWKVHDLIFSRGNITATTFEEITVESGLDADEIKNCLSDSAVLQRVREDAVLGNSLQVTSTPTVFLNGRKLPNTDGTSLGYIIEKVLAEKK